jgi:hypothetical protein
MRSRHLLWFFILVPLILSATLTIMLAPQPAQANLAGCPMFPPDNIWNTRVDNLPLHISSTQFVNSISATAPLHPDFGSIYGIPYTTVVSATPSIAITYRPPPDGFGDESDPGPYPVPLNAPIESGSDSHVLVVETTSCKLYELYHAATNGSGGWDADAGAVYTLTVNGPLRPDGWTSADAAGLPILPGLVRYDEAVTNGVITHAIRFTANVTQRKYVWPARHYASSNTSPNVPPLGQRFRLKASYQIPNGFAAETKAILQAMKTYGLILADNGSDWYFTGALDLRWNDNNLNQLKTLSGSDFEAVDVSSLMIDANSGQARIIVFDKFIWLPFIQR